MCSSHLDLISKLEEMPGFETMNNAIKLLNQEKLGAPVNNFANFSNPNFATLRRGEGASKARAALDPEKMYREVRQNFLFAITEMLRFK